MEVAPGPDVVVVLTNDERELLRLGLVIVGIKLGRYAPGVGQDETNDDGISLSDPVEMLRIRVDETKDPEGRLELRGSEIAMAWVAMEQVKNTESPSSDTESSGFKRWSMATNLSEQLAALVDFFLFRETDED